MTSPQPCDLLLVGATIVDLDVPGGVADGDAVAIRGSDIVAVGPAEAVAAGWRAAETLDLTGHYLAPGFVDAHVHLSAYLGAGTPYTPATGPGLFSGASRTADILPMIARMCSAPLPDELAAAVVRPVYAALVRSGFTGVVDAGGAGHRGLAAAAAAVGIRAAIGPSIADTWHDEHGVLVRQADTAAVLAAAEEVAADIDGFGAGLIRAVVSGIEPIACTDELLRGMAELTERLDLPTHVHTHISAASSAEHVAARGHGATTTLLEAGLLTRRCTVMHVGTLTDDDVATFARSGVTANHNPLGNALLGFGTVAGRAVPRLLDAGVPVVLGSDYAPSMVASPFDLLHACLMVHREAAAADDAITLEQALAMSSGDGAAVGRPGRLGRIAPGRLADLVAVRHTGAHHLGVAHPVPGLALRARPDDVTTTIVNGKVVVRDGALVTADEAELVVEAESALANLG